MCTQINWEEGNGHEPIGHISLAHRWSTTKGETPHRTDTNTEISRRSWNSAWPFGKLLKVRWPWVRIFKSQLYYSRLFLFSEMNIRWTFFGLFSNCETLLYSISIHTILYYNLTLTLILASGENISGGQGIAPTHQWLPSKQVFLVYPSSSWGTILELVN